MAVYQIQMTAQKQDDLTELEHALCSNQNFEFLCRTERSLTDSHILLLAFEQTFMRAGGTISLSVLFTETGEQQTADLIASGGGEGLGFSGGSCRSFVKEAAAILASYGFTDINPEPEEKLHQKILNYFFD